MKISKEAKIGFSTLVAICLLIWGFNFLKGKDIFKKTNAFYLEYNHLGGLKESNAVMVNGFQVGMVTDLNMSESGDRKVLVRILIDSEYEIPVGSIARLATIDIMGTKAIEMLLTENETYHKNGDTLNTKVATSIMQVLEDRIMSITNNLDSLLYGLKSTFDKGLETNIKGTMSNLNRSSGELSDMLKKDGEIQTIFFQLQDVVAQLSAAVEPLPNTIANVESLTDSLNQADIKKAIDQASETLAVLNQIMTKVDSGEGTVGKMINNDSLYVNLTNVSKELELLLNSVRETPKDYVQFSLFGKKSKK